MPIILSVVRYSSTRSSSNRIVSQRLSPGAIADSAGAAATATLAAEVALDVWLSEPCAGPEVLIPAALAAAQP